MNAPHPVRVGELRPSQLLWAYGCGSVVDLPQMSVIVMGLNYWDTGACVPVGEQRLLAAVRRVLGPQVSRLLGPPIRPGGDAGFDPFSPEARIGVPVSPFPRWLRCPLCGRMAEVGSGLFELKSNAFRPDKTQFVHSNCDRARGRSPTAVPARFLVACRGGHLDDFPWHFFVHGGQSDCPGPLKFFEQGASLQTENLWVRCERCSASRSMVDAFGDRGKDLLPKCRGRHPHLGRADHACDEHLRPVLLGASNSWFPVSLTVLAIPTKSEQLIQLLSDRLDVFGDLDTEAEVSTALKVLGRSGGLGPLGSYPPNEIWQALQRIRAAQEDGDEPATDLKNPEWEVFTNPEVPQDWPDFMATRVQPPAELQSYIESVVSCERLREVNALVGFTRVEPPEEAREGGDPPPRAPLTNAAAEWVPATEVRGEGIFLKCQTDRLAEWLSRADVKKREQELLQGHRAYRAARKLTPPEDGFPGILYVLLHTFAHVFIRELALECGYSAASVRERIYSSGYGEQPSVAGVLVYTAAPDSDGTLGGLVELGKPENLGRIISQAMRRATICASDPLCAEHEPAHDRSLHGAACHACSFVAETSCERGNRYLDRALLVPTLAGRDLAFFAGATHV